MATFSETRTMSFYVQTCYSCGMYFAVPDSFDSNRRMDGKNFFCPNGHPQMYTENDRILRERADRISEQLRAQLAAAKDQQAALQRDADAIKAKVAKGGCPCPHCKRQFVNLRRHIASKHPNFVKVKP